MSKILQSYLKFWATRFLKRTNPEIVAITGSVGKTSTKDAIFAVLKVKFGEDVRKSEGNLNNETGVPLAILGYKKSPSKFYEWLPIIISFPFKSILERSFKILILEMAADKPGDIRYLTSFIKPKIAVLTGIGPAHLAAFGSIENVTTEKTNLIRALPSDGWAVLNIDDENVRKLSYGGRWQVLTYSIEEKSDFQAKNIRTGLFKFEGVTTFLLKTEYEEFLIRLPSLGKKTNVYAALGAIAVGSIFKISFKSMSRMLAKLPSGNHRMEILKGKKNITIIDDAYNANPLSMKAALELMGELKAKRKIAVLGEMAELGRMALASHLEIGQFAKGHVEKIIGVGKLAKKYQPQKWFATAEEAGRFLLNEIKPGDIILIKGSRKVGLEKVAEVLS